MIKPRKYLALAALLVSSCAHLFGQDSVDRSQLPTALEPQTAYTVQVPYVASVERDVMVEFWKGSTWLNAKRTTVPAGSDTLSVTITLSSLPEDGTDYLWKASIRPVGTNWQENIDAGNVANVVISSGDTGGGNSGSEAWVESGGLVIMEPEHAELAADWVVQPSTNLTDPTMAGSLGSGWIEWNGTQVFNTTLDDAAANGVSTLRFLIETEGIYTFRWRTKQYDAGQTSDAGNDTYIKFETGTPQAIVGSKGGTYTLTKFTKAWVQSKEAWSWGTNFEPHHAEFVYSPKVHYTAGEHEIKIAGRSRGHSIDRIALHHSNVPFNETNFNSAPESERAVAGPYIFDANVDFPSITDGTVNYYDDTTYDVLAITPSAAAYDDTKFARATRTFYGLSGTYDVTISTMTEEDGECTYRLLVNGSIVASYQNPREGTPGYSGDLQAHTYTWNNISLRNGDTISIESNAHSNDLYPESNGANNFAWARGRWSQISITEPLSAAEDTQVAGIYGEQDSNGNYKKWHKVTVAFEGPTTTESAATNPFTDYRLNVTFTHSVSGKTYLVPGYYAADGNAGESSANGGNIWRVHFAPDELGTWNYSASFRTGANIAVDGSPTAGTAVYFDGNTGSFSVVASDKSGRDHRGKGRLQYDGSRYLKFAETGDPFLKTGADAPENFLNYLEFDNTYSNHDTDHRKDWSPHIQDWSIGDPYWKNYSGKGIIGAVNYLASEGQNVFSFLTYNAGGDSKDVWMYVAHDDPLRFDCSKLDQWEIVFSHGDKMGMYLHFKTQETENDDLSGPGAAYALDDGNLGNERKLYYRELIARFGHHLALNWNLGEETTQTTAQQQDMAQFFKDHDPYGHNIVLHTYPDQQEMRYRPLLGANSELTGVSIQTNFGNVHKHTLQWITESADAGKQWVAANDEQGSANLANPPDDGYPGYAGGTSPSQKDMRWKTVWGNFMAGGAGIELYAGYQNVQSDLTLDDFRSRDRMWDYCRHALTFFTDNLPFDEMANANALIGNNDNGNSKYCFAKENEVYAIYLPNGGSTDIDLSAASGTFEVKWFNPRDGGALQTSGVTLVSGGGTVSVGNPPADTSSDWAVLIERSNIVLDLPFSEDFEDHNNGESASTSNGWQQSGTGSADVQNTETDTGSRAVEVSNEVTLSRPFTSSHSVVWCDLKIRFATAEDGVNPALPDTASAAMFLDQSGYLNVADGSTWTIPAGLAPVATDAWQRITVRLDYGAQDYSVWLNDVRVAQDLGFVNAVANFSGFELDHSLAESTYLDNILADISEPSELDNDGDGLANWWEESAGLDKEDDGSGNPTYGPEGNPDGDEFNNLMELALDLDPNVNDSHRGPYSQSSTEGEQDYFGIVYRESMMTSKVDYVVQCLDNLAQTPWTTLTGSQRRVIDADPDGDGSCQLVEIRTPMDTPNKFLRLSAVTTN